MSQLGLAMYSRVQRLATILVSATPRGQESAWKFCSAEWSQRERTCWKICRWNQWRRQSGNSWVLSSKQGRVAKSFLSYRPEAKWGIFFFLPTLRLSIFILVLWVVFIVVWSLSTFGNKEAFVTGHQMLECCFYGKDFRILKLIHYLFLECHLLLWNG